ncbi:MAG: A/G-specific adenine glycosylase [Betaproteobacteria bacterium]
MRAFSRKLVAWQRRHGRHGLPWQGTRDPYRIWLAEVMLQQTQVEAARPYYLRFLERFPDVAALAAAPVGEVLRLWSGLGYYARARNLHAAARMVAGDLNGRFPDTAAGLEKLPGVGRSTAAAVAAFAFGRRAAILDGNVKRVLARQFGVEGTDEQWALAEKLLPSRGIESYTQGLMDLGATLCKRTRPECMRCPVAASCVALREGRIAELPAPKKRKLVPTRTATWLVLVHQGQVLLERRPPSGIWGGLWAFPEPGPGVLKRHCSVVLGCEIAPPRKMEVLEHGFTHFKLRAQPLRCLVKRALPRAGTGGRIWMDVAAAARAAVPAPVRALLERLG